MAIIQFPSHQKLPTTLPCVLCLMQIPSYKATAGLLDAKDKQTFACNSHFWDKSWGFIEAWITFATEQRMKILLRPSEPKNLYRWNDAQTLH